MSIEKLPAQEFLQEDAESLEVLMREKGVEHALFIAEKALKDIVKFIEKDITAGLNDSSEEMKEKWTRELHEWEAKRAGVESFIEEHTQS